MKRKRNLKKKKSSTYSKLRSLNSVLINLHLRLLIFIDLKYSFEARLTKTGYKIF